MIIKTYPNKNIYGKYFLATEAPDDEEVSEEQPKPKRNVKVVSVKPSNRSKDFTQVGNPPITPDDVEDTEDIDVDTTDYGTEEIPDTTDTPETTEPAAEEPVIDDTNAEASPEDATTDDAPDTGEGDTTDFTADDPAIDDTGEEGPDTGGDEDFTADTGEDTTDMATDDTTGDATADGGKPGVEFDSTRKYNLYKEYMSLYNACDNYISKLENILKNDNEENQLIRIAVKNLREIKDILSDYMTIRFQLNTYVQSLLFYQKMVVSVQLVFNLLKSIKPREDKNTKKHK